MISGKIISMPHIAQPTKKVLTSVIKSDFVKSPKSDCYITIPVKPHKPNILPNANMVVEKAISDDDLRQIHRIDMEAFSETDPISADFNTYKSCLTGLDSYAVKNNDSVVAYYQLEPIKNEDLYIYSIGVPKELRRSKQSYSALKLVQENIKIFAQENNVKTVSLHVDSGNEPLVRMYRKYGFEVVKTDPNYYANGNAAYYMEANVSKANNIDCPEIKSRKSILDLNKVKTQDDLRIYLSSFKYKNGEPRIDTDNLNRLVEYADTPEQVVIRANLVNKLAPIEKFSGEDMSWIAAQVNTLEQSSFQTDLALKLAPIEKLSGKDIQLIVSSTSTLEQALIRADFAHKLAPIEGLTGDHIREMVRSAKTQKQVQIKLELFPKLTHYAEALTTFANSPERADLILTLNSMERFKDNNALLTIVKFADTPEKASLAAKIASIKKLGILDIEAISKRADTAEKVQVKADAVHKLASIEKLNGSQIRSIVEDINTQEEAIIKFDLVSKLAPIEKLDGEQIRLLATLTHTNDPEVVIIKSDAAHKLAEIKNLDGDAVLWIAHYVNTPEEAVFRTYAASKLSNIEKFNNNNIHIMTNSAKTSEQALFKVKLASQLASNKELSGTAIQRIIESADTVEKADFVSKILNIEKFDTDSIIYMTQLIDNSERAAVRLGLMNKLTPIEKFNSKNIQDIVNTVATADQALIKTDFINKIASFEKLSGDNITNIVGRINTPEEVFFKKNLINGLISIEKLNGDNITYIANSANTIEKAALRGDLAEKLAPTGLDGKCMQTIITSTNTPEKSLLLYNLATKLISTQKLDGGNMSAIFEMTDKEEELLNMLTLLDNKGFLNQFNSRNDRVLLLTTSCRSFEKMVLAIKLATIEKLDKYNLTAIIGAANTPEKAQEILNLVHDEVFWEKAQALQELYKSWEKANVRLELDRLCSPVELLKSAIPAEVININRIDKLFNFIKENKMLLQKYGEQTVDEKSVAELFDVKMISAFEILDDDVIKYAMKLKIKGFGEFIESISKLKEKLDVETYTNLKNKLSEITMPEQKLKILQNISCLLENHFPVDDVNEAVNLIKSTKVTDEQIELAKSIFISDTSYPEQIQEFLTKFNVPTERRDRVIAFIEKHKVNEKVFFDRKTSKKTFNGGKNLFTELIERHINVINSNKDFNCFINSKIYQRLGIEPTPELLEKLNFDQQYLSNLFLAVKKEGFVTEFKNLIELIKTDTSKPLSELRETLAHNQETKKLFEANGIDYLKWIKFDEKLYKSFSLELSVEDALKAVEEHIASELTSDLFKSVEKAETDKILQALNNAGYKVSSKKITKNEGEINKKDLEKIVNIFKDTINENLEFWDKSLPDKEAESLKNELRNHLLTGRRKEVSDLDRMSDTKMELIARLSDDDDVGRNIFVGNHIGCCTSVNNDNGFAAPQHLMNSFVRTIEIVDKSGLSYGNSMCYFAKIDGKLSFIIDSFEANGKLGGNSAVTDAIIAYAKEVAVAMGKADIPIYFGPNYNKISMNALKRTSNHKIEIIGKVDAGTYIDAIGGRQDVNIAHSGRDLFEENLKKAA